jgi:hypothetical protein
VNYNLLFTALGSAISIISGIIAIYDKSRLGSQARQTKVAVGFTIVTVAVTFIFFLASIWPLGYSSGNNGNNTPVVNSGTSQSPQTLSQQPTVPPTPTPTLPSTPTPIPRPAPNTVLYQADQSWSGWSGSNDWKIVNGMLVNNGSGGTLGPSIIAPYDLGNVSDYAVEATIQVVHWNSCCYSLFAIVARAVSTSAGSQGYSFQDDVQASAVQVTPSPSYSSNALTGAPFAPGNTFHTYRAEVKGNSLKLFIDGGPKFDIADNSYSSGGQVGFWSYGVQLNISSFKIIAL